MDASAQTVTRRAATGERERFRVRLLLRFSAAIPWRFVTRISARPKRVAGNLITGSPEVQENFRWLLQHVAVSRRPLRSDRRPDWLPPVAGWMALVLGLANIASTLTPDDGARANLVRDTMPREVPLLAHALALPAGLALVMVGFYLSRRRSRAWAAAVAILLVSGVLNLVKGLDVEEALVCWMLAAFLGWGRKAFVVEHDQQDGRTVAARLALLLGALFAAVTIGIVTAFYWGTPPLPVAGIPLQAVSLLTFGSGSVHYPEAMGWLPIGVGLTGVGVLLATGYLLCRPLAVAGGLPGPVLRGEVRRMVSVYGDDTLSFFKLRDDNHYFFDSRHEAFVGYRIEHGVLLVSGDPVGPSSAIPRLLGELCAFAEVRSIKVAAVGASAAFAETARGAGLRSFYMGDEAIIDIDRFSLEGRAIRKVRQSVSRLSKDGYSAEAAELEEVSDGDLREMKAVSAHWLAGAPERGFSMAMDGLRAERFGDSTVVLARDHAGTVRGFLHFVPARGGAVMSLSAMRRDPRTPNGLTEFMVVEAVRLLGERGTQELSLNFAAFARLLHSPRGKLDRLLARLLAIADGQFQIESLYKFNAKFFPRWQERYLLYDGALGLPRAGLVTLSAEGQMPKMRLPAWMARLMTSGQP